MSQSATLASAAPAKSDVETSTIRAISWRLIPFLVLAYFFSYLDRVNLGFAALTMNAELKFTPLIFAWGAGIFFIGYFIFEVPSNVILERVGARIWIARIMITWGIISSAFMFTGNIHWGPVSEMFGVSDSPSPSTSCAFCSGWRRPDSSPASSCISPIGFPGRGAPRWSRCS